MTDIAALIKKADLNETRSAEIEAYFKSFSKVAEEWGDRVYDIKVTEEDQVETMQKARVMRLELKSTRVSLEKLRKELKAAALKEGQLIDGVARILKGIIEPMEEYLQEQESFKARAEAARLAVLIAKRTSQLEALGQDPLSYRLSDITQEQFDVILESARVTKHAQDEARRKEEQEIAARAEAAEKARKEEEAERKAERARMTKERERIALERADLDIKRAQMQKDERERQLKIAEEKARQIEEQREERARLEAEKVAEAEPAGMPSYFKDLYENSPRLEKAFNIAFEAEVLVEVPAVKGAAAKWVKRNAIQRNAARELIDLFIEEVLK